MAKAKGRYGLTDKQMESLNNYWNHAKVKSEWPGPFDRFANWSAENGWKPLCKLKKRNGSRPHSPRNSYWQTANETEDTMPTGCPCIKCDNAAKDRCSVACAERLAFWDNHMDAIRRTLYEQKET